MEPPSTPPSRTTSNEVGTTLLGKYQLGRLLGRGSFAKVYHATSLADGSAVAIKAIDKSQTLAAAMEPRILGEIAAMRRLNPHPNILKIHEVMATKSKIYLVMELARGGELLSQIYRRGRLTEPAARRYFQQLISALRYCHQNGVAHRDVKPQNLLLDHNGNIKVSDFGLSALPEQLKNGLLHTACGTPAYTAPEVIGRKGYDGPKADAWSCGVMLFVFLAGFHPFDDSNLVAMYRKIYRRDFQFPAWISKPARWIISRLLDPNPETRMTIQAVTESSWFKKSLQSPLDTSWFNMDLFFVKDSRSDPISDSATVMNAFDIISLSSGLDLSGLFDVTNNKKEKRFTSASSKDMMVERVVEIGAKLGYSVQKGKSGSVGLGKGRLVLLIEVLEVAQSLLLVEVKIIGGGVEFDELHWGDLKAGFEDLVLSWQNDEI